MNTKESAWLGMELRVRGKSPTPFKQSSLFFFLSLFPLFFFAPYVDAAAAASTATLKLGRLKLNAPASSAVSVLVVVTVATSSK